jgi:GNAT superfamily N-acetyltransferase
MSFELIQATEADRAFLFALRKLTMVEHLEKAGLYLSAEEHAFRLNDDYECSYLIVCCGEKVGTLKYRELADKIEIMQLQVHPESQGKGLGKQVME